MFKKIRKSIKMRKIEKSALLENMDAEGRSMLESVVIFGAKPQSLEPVLFEEKDDEICDTVDDNGDLIDDKKDKDSKDNNGKKQEKDNKDNDDKGE